MHATAVRPGWFWRLARCVRSLTRHRIPKRIRDRFVQLDSQGVGEFAACLHEFRRQTRGLPAVEDEDFQNHLHRRLDDNRQRVIPWLDAARGLDGAAVLEIGCGTGSATVPLAEQGARVTAVDVDERAIAVAQQRCRLYGVEARFMTANATQLDSVLSSEAFDYVIFFASLEHMTHQERMTAMRGTWRSLPSGGLWCVVEAPNRLWYYDHHTALLNFFMWLSDELAVDYLPFSGRQDVLAEVSQAADPLTGLRRAGRGVSFHEFDLAFGPADKLDVVSSLTTFYRSRDPFLWLLWRCSFDSRYERLLARLCPRLHPGFLQPTLDLIIRKW